VLCDSGGPRNAVTGVVHGFLSRDGIDPAELRRIAAEELRRYPTVELRTVGVETARLVDGGFGVTLADGGEETASKLILATGVVDELPRDRGARGALGPSRRPLRLLRRVRAQRPADRGNRDVRSSPDARWATTIGAT
jgi:hypothetical protein